MSSHESPLFDLSKTGSASYDYACVSPRLLQCSYRTEDGSTSFVQFAPMIRATVGSDSTEAKMCAAVISSDNTWNSLKVDVAERLAQDATTMKWLHQDSRLAAAGKTLSEWAKTVSQAVEPASRKFASERGYSAIHFHDRDSTATSNITWKDSLLSKLVLDSTGWSIFGNDDFVLATKPIRVWPGGVSSKSWNVNGGNMHFPPLYTRMAHRLLTPNVTDFNVTNHSAQTLDEMTKNNLDKTGGPSTHGSFSTEWNRLIETGNPWIVSFVMTNVLEKERKSLVDAAKNLGLQVENPDPDCPVESGFRT
ncbi:hypothetical protein JCM24511_05431 [Saitozyma sp. JCM 24511]|nr:hypothetical protein JCM24511_05431 [Saitozyma sp. JCM 24511]